MLKETEEKVFMLKQVLPESKPENYYLIFKIDSAGTFGTVSGHTS